jgi:hypothetical protein
MNEDNIILLKQIITRRKEIYDFFVKHFGEDYPLTRDILKSISSLTYLLSKIEQHKINLQ